MDVYVVMDGPRIVGISARQQGAELIRAGEAKRQADIEVTRYCDHYDPPAWLETLRRRAYDGLRIENHELQDIE